MDNAMMNQDGLMPDKSMKDKMGSDSNSVMAPKSILMGKDFKVGDEVVLKVKSMQGDMVELEYAPEPGMEDMSKMSDEDLHKMPLDKMEKGLPKAQREY